jgi:signal transduction histidine kinase
VTRAERIANVSTIRRLSDVPEPLRYLALAVVIGGLYALGALLTFWYLDAPDAGAAFFPSAGITLAVLLLTHHRTWPLWLVAAAVAEISVDLVHHQTVFMAVGFAIANTVEPAVGAGLTRAVARRRRATPRGFLMRYVVCAVIAGPFVGGCIGGVVATIAGTGHLPSTSARWWLGDALGVLVVATPVLAWTRRGFYETAAAMPEIAGIAGCAIVVTIVPATIFHESFAYAVLPVLMLAALRGGPLGVGVSGFVVGFSASWVVATGRASALLTVGHREDALIDTQLFIAVTLLAALAFAVAVAERARAERLSREAQTKRVRAEVAAMQAAAGERRRIARETHDIIGHALNVIILSGAAARRVLDRDVEKAKALLSAVEDAGRDAFRDLDVALGLTDQSPDFAPLQGLADIDELVGHLVDTGMRVEYIIDGSVRPLPRLVDGSAYRIIQESLTNVAKHAVNAHTRVSVSYKPEMLRVEVSDGGNGRTSGNRASQRGLFGMRERVAVLGGRIEAGPRGDGGYSVVAKLPT